MGILEILRLISAKLLEPIYFSLFLIYGKNLKQKRILFTCIMIFEYIMLTELIYYNVVFQVAYTFMTFLTLKVLYKSKAQITDIFLFGVASIILISISLISYLSILFTIKNYYIAMILNRILLFSFIFIFKNKINYLYKRFYKYWNRHNNSKVIKSLTLRNISIIMFNLMFWVINFGMIYSKFLN